jgi:hypothetical protein
MLDNRDSKGNQEKRYDHSIYVRKKMQQMNKDWTDQQYLSWVQSQNSRLGVENIEISLNKHTKNQYDLNNSHYR